MVISKYRAELEERRVKLAREIIQIDKQLDAAGGGPGFGLDPGASNQASWTPRVTEAVEQDDGIRTRAEQIDDIFSYHDRAAAIPHYTEIREAAKAFAHVIDRHTPPSKDRDLGFLLLRMVVMFANAANALDGRGI